MKKFIFLLTVLVMALAPVIVDAKVDNTTERNKASPVVSTAVILTTCLGDISSPQNFMMVNMLRMVTQSQNFTLTMNLNSLMLSSSPRSAQKRNSNSNLSNNAEISLFNPWMALTLKYPLHGVTSMSFAQMSTTCDTEMQISSLTVSPIFLFPN